MLGKRVALLAFVAALGASALAQLRPGDKLTLPQYSEKLRQLTLLQNRATYQLQQGSALVMRRGGTTLKQAMANLVPVYQLYISQVASIRDVYARLNPPAVAKPLNNTFVDGGTTLVNLAAESLVPLKNGDEAALKKVRLKLRDFAIQFPKKVKAIVVASGFDYAVYEKKTELVLKKKKAPAHR